MAIRNDHLSEKTIDTIRNVYGNNAFSAALLEYHGNKEKEMDTKTIVYSGDETPPKGVINQLSRRLQDLSAYLDTDIVWVTCHGGRRNVPEKVDARMHIFSMMTPAWVEFDRIKINSFIINGQTLILPPGQMDYLDPVADSNNEIPGCDGIYDGHGVLMALVVGYNIYILNDCIHCCNPNGLPTAMEVFEHIINEAVKLWNECEEGGEEENETKD